MSIPRLAYSFPSFGHVAPKLAQPGHSNTPVTHLRPGTQQLIINRRYLNVDPIRRVLHVGNDAATQLDLKTIFHQHKRHMGIHIIDQPDWREAEKWIRHNACGVIVLNPASGTDKTPLRFLHALQRRRHADLKPFVILLSSDPKTGIIEEAIRHGKFKVDAIVYKNNAKEKEKMYKSPLGQLIEKVREGVGSHQNMGAYI